MALTEQEVVRRDNLRKIEELGINPFPAEQFYVTHLAADVKAELCSFQSSILSEGSTRIILTSGSAFVKASMVCASKGFPPIVKNCFGVELPIRSPLPPAVMTTHLFKLLLSMDLTL